MQDKTYPLCCDGYFIVEGRSGSEQVYVHTRECKKGQQEKEERRYWERTNR